MIRIYSNKLQPPVPLSNPKGVPTYPAQNKQPTVPDYQADAAWNVYSQIAQSAASGNPKAIAQLNQFHQVAGIQRFPYNSGALDKNSFKQYWSNPGNNLRNAYSRFSAMFQGILSDFKRAVQPMMQGTPLP